MIEKVLGFKEKGAKIEKDATGFEYQFTFGAKDKVPVVSLEEHRRLLSKETIRVNNIIKATDKLCLRRLYKNNKKQISLEWLFPLLDELEKELVNDISAFQITDYTHLRFKSLKNKIKKRQARRKKNE